MKKQSMLQQLALGITLGLVIFYIKNYQKWYWAADEYMVGQVTGAAIGGAFWYCLLYRLWPKKK